MDAQIARELDLQLVEGLLVMRTERSSTAYESGLRPGDVVVQANGRRVEDTGQLQRLVADAPLNSTLKLRVQRGTRQIDVQIPVVQATRRRQAASY